MTSLPGRQRSAARWIVIGVVAALALVATLLTVNLLNNPPNGTGPTASPSTGEPATLGPSDTPMASAAVSFSPAEVRPAAWTATGAMIEARTYPTATLLNDGKVLVAGGVSSVSLGGYAASGSAELYDPINGIWIGTLPMITPRYQHTATLLLDGTVLVAGGRSGIIDDPPSASAEIYDPRNGTWTATSRMIEARNNHTATLLPDGKVLVAGGIGPGASGLGDDTASAELYDPISRTWTATRGMSGSRFSHTATLLPNGRVLVAGGSGGDPYHPLASAELYDPDRGVWTLAANMHEARDGHTATLFTGAVLVAGGSGGSGTDPYLPLASAELYDPDSGVWTLIANMHEARQSLTATRLRDGRVLVAGGQSADTLPSAELYDPNSRSWITTASPIEARANQAAALLLDGTVLVAGQFGTQVSAELYDPGSGT